MKYPKSGGLVQNLDPRKTFTAEGEGRGGKGREGKGREGKGREGKGREEKRREGKNI
jgi:hypothetical protein